MLGGIKLLKELIDKNRTYRRFYQNERMNMETLRELVDYARISSSGANRQPLKYIISNDEKKNQLIFSNLKWAGYLKDWDGPVVGERPSAYIIVLIDTTISKNPMWDHGIASTNILLGATEKGYGGCMVASINKEQVIKELHIPEHYEILMVIALGKPREEVILYEIGNGDDIKYWRDEKQTHHVPKRKLHDVILDL